MRGVAVAFAPYSTLQRKERGLTQQQMADTIGVHIFRRYEAGTTQPTIEVFRRTVLALSVSADMLLFDEGERGQDDKEREAPETVISSVLHMHDAKRWTQAATKRDSLPGQ